MHVIRFLLRLNLLCAFLEDELRLDKLENLLTVETETGKDRSTDSLQFTNLPLVRLKLIFQSLNPLLVHDDC